VRDDYNNPKRGVTVNANANEGSIDGSEETTRDGEATFEYDSSGVDPGQDDVNFSIAEGYEPDSSHNPESPENLTIEMMVEQESTGQVGEDNVSGPKTTTLVDEVTVFEGQSFSFEAIADSVGTPDQIRSGTPIHHIWWESEDIGVDRDETEQSFDPDTSNRIQSYSFEDIDTTDWDSDDEITVKAQDASGRITPDDDAGGFSVTVDEPPEELFFAVTIDTYDQEVTEGDTLTVSYTITNVGNQAGEQDIDFTVSDDEQNEVFTDVEEDVSLDADEEFQGSFSYTTEEGDAPSLEVEVSSEDDSEQRDINVNQALIFSYTDEPDRYTNQQDDIEFEIQNDGAEEVSIAEFEVRDLDEDYSSFQSYTIMPPQDQNEITGLGGFNLDERVSHDNYDIAPSETATYQLDDFDINNMNGEDFQLIIYTDDGRQHEFEIVSVS